MGKEWGGGLLLSDSHKTSVVYKYKPHQSHMTQIVTVCQMVEIPSILYVQELVPQLNSPQTDIHVKEFKYNSCGQTDTTFTMEMDSTLLTLFNHLI